MNELIILGVVLLVCGAMPVVCGTMAVIYYKLVLKSKKSIGQILKEI
jgi:cytochrome c biogenesis factor